MITVEKMRGVDKVNKNDLTCGIHKVRSYIVYTAIEA